ncbi:MAG: 2,3-bisphosphoglycerate-independent phosphoglycerate mutase, partial [Patescibacteria group bacterium]
MNPLVLVVLDGWGLNPLFDGNPTLQVATPYFDYLLKNYPHTGLHASGEEVGLSWAEMGNSEVGHLNLGCGRIIMQNLPRINQSIEDKSFFSNPELLSAFEFAKTHHSNVHLIGLASAGGVHSHLNHLLA